VQPHAAKKTGSIYEAGFTGGRLKVARLEPSGSDGGRQRRRTSILGMQLCALTVTAFAKIQSHTHVQEQNILNPMG
jgi:hypothetical protein